MVNLHYAGEYAPEEENVGNVTYTSLQGLFCYFFLYWNQLGYLQPVVVTVKLANPARTILIEIQCMTWAKKIEHGRHKSGGDRYTDSSLRTHNIATVTVFN